MSQMDFWPDPMQLHIKQQAAPLAVIWLEIVLEILDCF